MPTSLQLSLIDPASWKSIVEDIIRIESKQYTQQRCEGCCDPGTNRCQDCMWCPLLCRLCILNRHALLPLHRIRIVEGIALKPASLKDLSLRIQLGHGSLNFCPDPVEAEGFSILDLFGAHDVSLNYCGCYPAPSRGQKLTDACLYPLRSGGEESMINPDGAVSFELVWYYEEMLKEEGSSSEEEEEEEDSAALTIAPGTSDGGLICTVCPSCSTPTSLKRVPRSSA
ncbi:hypothetical protein B0H17DRAFT_1124224 [Mycena rosella]|uniref:CxC2-like cysteine cluster KDZ transposase-associated domain-containing protein n=1 Tax=Mycena rosella TaxID=1033263 RepID=A0AAD7MC43_MYCRO|nr:hypothetical protein B0H17DRAFT_1124224 [Mycena rosella]